MGFVHALHAFERSWNGKPHLKVDLFLYKYNTMKINTILFLSMLLGLMMGSCHSEQKVPEGEFLIEGFVKNLPDSSIVSLFQFENRKYAAAMLSDTVTDGRFVLRDTITSKESRQLLLLVIYKKTFSVWPLSLWVVSGAKIRIQGEGMLCPFWTVESEVPEQQAEAEFTKLGMPEMVEAFKQEMIVYEMFDKSINDISIRNKIDSIRRNHIYPLQDKVRLRELEYMKTAPVTKVWLEKYCDQLSFLNWNPDSQYSHKELVYPLYARLSEADRKSLVGREIATYIKMVEPVKEGDHMVDGTLYDTEGNTHHLSEFEGKYILLDFWNLGCQPCMEALPEMEEVSRMYKGKLELVSICGAAKNRWKKFVAEKKLTGHQWNELREVNDGLAAVYGVKGVPHYVLISPERKVIHSWMGYRKHILKEKMKEFVK